MESIRILLRLKKKKCTSKKSINEVLLYKKNEKSIFFLPWKMYSSEMRN